MATFRYMEAEIPHTKISSDFTRTIIF